MRKYFYGNRENYSIVIGNGSKEYRGCPLDLLFTSYGWVTRKNKRGIKEGWADSRLDIGPLSIGWQFSTGKYSIHLSGNIEFKWQRDTKIS